MRCHFCFNEGDVPKLSKEHLLSKPVATAFGVDRSAAFGLLGDPNELIVLPRLSDLSVRLVCEPCNNTWMNDLEHGMAALNGWCHGGDLPMTSSQVDALRSWCLKTYLVLSAMVGGTRRFAEDPEAPGVIPNFTRARQLYERNPEAFEGMAFGAARTIEPNRFAYAFGNPTVIPTGPRHANQKSAGLSIVTIGSLQVWTVDPTIFRAARIRFPDGVTTVAAGIRYRKMQTMPLVPRLEDAIVDNGDHDIVELMEQAVAWAKAQSAE